MTSAESSLTALTRYQVRLSGSTVRTPVSNVLTTSGKTVSISCAITPNWTPSFSTAADFTTSVNSGASWIISSWFLYSKFLTWIWLIASSQPHSDVDDSADYRANMVRAFTKKAVDAC